MKCGLELGEVAESGAHPQAFLGLPGSQSREPLGVFIEATESQCLRAISAQCPHQRPGQGVLVLRPSLPDGDNVMMRDHPLVH